MSKLVELGAVTAETKAQYITGTQPDGVKEFRAEVNNWVIMKTVFDPTIPPQIGPPG